MEIKPIKTRYNGYLFRSRAEARWAVLFDALNIKYIYEPEGLELSDGTRYLPDFYLPEIKTYFEVKGLMTGTDMHKIEQLQDDLNTRIGIGFSDMTFRASSYFGEGAWLIEDAEGSMLVECLDCGHKYFEGVQGGWQCPVCGSCGNFWRLATGDFPKGKFFDKARAAQFEFTEDI